jgi:hypothetical protein
MVLQLSKAADEWIGPWGFFFIGLLLFFFFEGLIVTIGWRWGWLIRTCPLVYKKQGRISVLDLRGGGKKKRRRRRGQRERRWKRRKRRRMKSRKRIKRRRREAEAKKRRRRGRGD